MAGQRNRIFDDYFAAGSVVSRETFDCITGEELGSGISRVVFVSRMNSKQVVKFDVVSKDRFQNATEWEIWRSIKGTSIARWFAPCHWISDYGTLLTQSRVTPLVHGKLPMKRVPSFLCDMKPENFGWLDGRLVCCDYGILTEHLIALSGGLYHNRKLKLVRPDWKTNS